MKHFLWDNHVLIPSAGFPSFPSEAGGSGTHPGAQDWRTCTRPCVFERRSTSPAWKGRSLPTTRSLLSRRLVLVTSALMKGSRAWRTRPVTRFSWLSHEPALGPLADDLPRFFCRLKVGHAGGHSRTSQDRYERSEVARDGEAFRKPDLSHKCAFVMHRRQGLLWRMPGRAPPPGPRPQAPDRLCCCSALCSEFSLFA